MKVTIFPEAGDDARAVCTIAAEVRMRKGVTGVEFTFNEKYVEVETGECPNCVYLKWSFTRPTPGSI